jgi:hypothetical protein
MYYRRSEGLRLTRKTAKALSSGMSADRGRADGNQIGSTGAWGAQAWDCEASVDAGTAASVTGASSRETTSNVTMPIVIPAKRSMPIMMLVGGPSPYISVSSPAGPGRILRPHEPGRLDVSARHHGRAWKAAISRATHAFSPRPHLLPCSHHSRSARSPHGG